MPAAPLDDFGCEHATLPTLRRFGVSEIKVDRGLATRVDTEPFGARTVAFVAEVGSMLGAAVVAEGIERPEKLRMVASLGVTRAQGYPLARPVPEGDVAAAAAELTAKDALGGEWRH